jgi:uncharacterized protein YecE (DUF72 family)
MLKIGCCGYPISTKKCYENFRLVELNRTFYAYPKVSTVAGWREKAPQDFEFTVKAHQDITHNFRFELKRGLPAFETVKKICQMLKTRVLLFQTPGSFTPNRLSDAEKFLRKITRDNLKVAWETRGSAWDTLEVREKSAARLKALDVVHVTDPFRALPTYTGNIAYFRLHGLGERLYFYQFSDDELKQLRRLVQPFERSRKEVYVLFNNLAMFDDAQRFAHYVETGLFPSLTGTIGTDSVRMVIEKTRYPAAKSVLSTRLGWRLVELEKGKQARLEEILKPLTSKTYRGIDEVLHEIERTHR